MRALIVTTILIGMCSIAYGLGNDTIVFKTDSESRQVRLARGSDIDIINLLISFDSDSLAALDAKRKLDQFFAHVQSKNLKRKSTKTFAKAIFQEAHDFFLDKHHFYFSDNNYQCHSERPLK
jgi:hypothetical protein